MLIIYILSLFNTSLLFEPKDVDMILTPKRIKLTPMIIYILSLFNTSLLFEPKDVDIIWTPNCTQIYTNNKLNTIIII